MPMIWNAEAEAKLLAAVIKTSDGIQFKPVEIARYMGPECTAKAISHRITHIKKHVESLVPDEEGAAPAANGNGAASTTPKTPKSTGKKRGAANGDAGGSPSQNKKAKTPTGKGKGKKGAAEVKAEEGEKGDKVKSESENENGDKIKSESDTGAAGDADSDDA